MPKWLIIASDQKASWPKGILEKKDEVTWLDRIPNLKDLESKELIIEAFSDGSVKERTLKEIGKFEDWKGSIASFIEKGAVTKGALQNGVGARVVVFRICPSLDDFRSVELLKGEGTSEESLRVVQHGFEELGFPVVVCKDQAGGILPRVLAAMINEAAYMALDEIASVEEIDRMMGLGANFPMGPFEWADRIGLDHVLNTLETLSQELGQTYNPCPLIRRKVEAGHLGVKSGEGFYQHAARGAF